MPRVRCIGPGSILSPPSLNAMITPSWQSASEAKIPRSRNIKGRWRRKISPHRCAKLFPVSMPKCKAHTTASSYFATRWRLSIHSEQSGAAVYSSRRRGRRRITPVRYEFRPLETAATDSSCRAKVETSRSETFKVTPRDSSTLLGMTRKLRLLTIGLVAYATTSWRRSASCASAVGKTLSRVLLRRRRHRYPRSHRARCLAARC